MNNPVIYPANYPIVDDGTIYNEITNVIKNSNFVFDIYGQMTMVALQQLIPDCKFNKVADCLLNTVENHSGNKPKQFIDGVDFTGQLVTYTPLDSMKDLWETQPKEWIYTIVYNGRIVKIGMTSTGLLSRFNSYKSGTTLAMRKGSCATTNFVVSQCNYLALLKGIKVEIYAYEIPQMITEQVIFGKKEKVLNKVAHKFETTLIGIYKDIIGATPPF